DIRQRRGRRAGCNGTLLRREEITMGILKTAAKVAVASSVHGRIQRRQQQRWAAQDQMAATAAAPPPAPAAGPAPPTDMRARRAQLEQLGEVLSGGVLTQAEFEQQKPKILSG